MTEDDLRKLSFDELIDLMIQSTKELTDIIHKEDKKELQAKRQEVQLIQKAIVAKRAEFRPGSPL
jgi:hypothetical protein